MKLPAKQSVEVDIEDYEILKAAVKIIEKRQGISGHFLKGKEVRTNDDYYHGSVSDHLVRKATSKDIKAFKCVELLCEFNK